ncbi:Hypothetical predicted protein [Mytilus galloprovincialis]|uniref:Reverse transcriptase zinc-binding domain-containing protein n=1 Tax=Mytilus galloprovincialis TaxID=29158 RepID=A0A8B6G3A8_MYTGA|nr:Hypothetical predicted protein [Mytilus galloprovincialis]
MQEAIRWRNAFPNAYFGFTGEVNKFDQEQGQVVSSLPLHRILLESDAPYFRPSWVPNNSYGHPQYIAEVAIGLLAFMSGDTLWALLEATTSNARALYRVLEVLPLNARQLKALSDFHLTFLRNIQSLPVRTASVAIYALLGALPLEAELDKRQLSLLHSILTSENQNLKEILIRQYRLQVNQGTFLERTESILNKYNLPTIEEVWENTPTKINWKHTTRSAIIKFWQEWIKTEISQKSTLHRLDINSINIGETHAVWNTALNLPGETKRAIIKARILTGPYMLQAKKAKFQIENADSTCPICRIEEENLSHFITRCPVLEGIRRKHYGTIKQEIVNKIGSIQWNSNLRDRDIICQLITCI